MVVLKDAKNKKAYEQSAQLACEASAAIRTVASLTREDDCVDIYSKSLQIPQQLSNRTAFLANAYYSGAQSLSFFVIGLIFYYGSHQLVAGQLTTTGFFVTMISYVIPPGTTRISCSNGCPPPYRIVFASIQVGNIFNYVADMSKAEGAARSIINLLDARPEIELRDGSGVHVDSASFQGAIRFDTVHFRYETRPHVKVLSGLTLDIKPGQFVAIVGASGCGKSTMIQLCESFYHPLYGKIMVDGHDLTTLNIESYRRQVSLVSQEPVSIHFSECTSQYS